MKRLMSRIAAGIVFLLFGTSGFQNCDAVQISDVPRLIDPDLRACANRTLPQHTMTQQLAVAVTDATTGTRESSGTLKWKRFDDGFSKVLVRIDKSSAYAGVALLLVEREKREPDVFMYSRELQQERRIVTSALAGPLLGTDFTYEDFAFLQHVMENGKIMRGPDIEVDGHPAYVIETTQDEDTSAYSRIRTVIDKAWCVPIKTEFFGPNGSVAKELNVERADVEQIGERWVPRQMTMINHKSESRTVLKLTDIKFEPELGDNLFMPASLRLGH